MVCSGLGTRAKLMPLWSKIDMVQSSLGCCWVMMRWNRLERHVEAHFVDHLGAAEHRNADGDDLARGHRADEQIRVGRLAGGEHLLDRVAVEARRRRLAGRQAGVQHLPAVAGGERNRLAGISPQQRRGVFPEAVEIARAAAPAMPASTSSASVTPCISVSSTSRMPRDHLEHAVEGGFAMAHVVEVDDAAGEQDQRQHGAGHQKRQPQPKR